MGTPITSWHAARSAACFFGASRRILCRALEMKTCIVRCSSASGGEPGTAGAAPDILLPRATLAAALALSHLRVTYTQVAVVFSLLTLTLVSPFIFPLYISDIGRNQRTFDSELEVWPWLCPAPG